jgi:hypothetical protein
MPVFDPLVAEYRYFVADFLTNAVIAELPLKGVSYERAIKGAGTFSANIPVIDKTAAYNLYESTMPGKTALYVVRNDECVWGGIIWSRSYSVESRDLSISASEFTSYLHHRLIWKTYSHDFPATVVASGGVANVTLTNGSFNFTAGVPVRIAFYEAVNATYNTNATILSSPAPTTTTFSINVAGLPNGTYNNVTAMVRVDTFDYVRSLLNEMLVDFENIDFPNDEIEPAKQTIKSVTNKSLTNNTATLTIGADHEVAIGQSVDVLSVDATFNGTHEVTATTATTISYAKTAGNVASTPVSSTSASIISRTAIVVEENGTLTGIGVLQTSSPVTFSVGDYVTITGVDAATLDKPIYNGVHRVTQVFPPGSLVYNNAFAIQVRTDAPSEILQSISPSGTAATSPQVVYGTYGPYPANADFGLDYSTAAYSGVYISTLDKVRRGYELKSIGEELDEYSDILDGFEYRIDCSYDTATSSFKRTFVLIPINFPNPPPPGEVSPITRFGAQNYVFEYPGNISNVTLDESAEDAATRFFVTGSDSTLGNDASQPYAAATSTDFLSQGWPLLDQEETRSDTYDEDQLYSYAQRYLTEFLPPVSDLKISVNGSLAPTVGTYNPGDWCAIIINDDFVALRLESNLEPRNDIIVRKIESYRVSVPDNPAFPEQVELNLITEWEVDKRG